MAYAVMPRRSSLINKKAGGQGANPESQYPNIPISNVSYVRKISRGVGNINISELYKGNGQNQLISELWQEV